MTGKQQRIQALIKSVIAYLRSCTGASQGVDLVLSKLAGMDLSDKNLVDMPPQKSRHDAVLGSAIDLITSPQLSEIANCLRAAKEDLTWCEDNSEFYSPNADLGAGYKKCNLHTLLIGPNSCGYSQPDFSLGIFMLGPWTLYRDHCHDAPELYLNLSERSGWRFGDQQWMDYSAGSFVWNEAGAPHATRVYGQPFISVFVWLENVNSTCNVIHFDDWEEIEQKLASQII